jgi:predicted naringenin-chalcone synthase
MHFASKVYTQNETEKRKLAFLYRQSGIRCRYSVIPDFTDAGDEAKNRFFKGTQAEVPGISQRMEWYHNEACPLALEAIENCLNQQLPINEITHLITVSCTGMSAPGLDLQIMEALHLPETLVRTSVNFMGCYAAIHALKMADSICARHPGARVLMVCVELCTIHFQHEPLEDNITSSLLFGDGAAAVLVTSKSELPQQPGINLNGFYSKVLFAGKDEMTWNISPTGFLMTLTGEVPDLIKKDIAKLVEAALETHQLSQQDISYWCFHPGGRKILDDIAGSLDLEKNSLQQSYQVLEDFGNMSSPTILFVLQRIFESCKSSQQENAPHIFGAAFGPGLTMETFTASYG